MYIPPIVFGPDQLHLALVGLTMSGSMPCCQWKVVFLDNIRTYKEANDGVDEMGILGVFRFDCNCHLKFDIWLSIQCYVIFMENSKFNRDHSYQVIEAIDTLIKVSSNNYFHSQCVCQRLHVSNDSCSCSSLQDSNKN